MAAKENLLNNGFSDDQVKVVYKRPTDLAMLRVGHGRYCPPQHRRAF
jgi:hypothetical protein